MILAVILYLFRPNSLRRQRNVDEKQPLSSGQVWCRLELLVRSTVISSLVVYMTNQPSIWLTGTQRQQRRTAASCQLIWPIEHRSLAAASPRLSTNKAMLQRLNHTGGLLQNIHRKGKFKYSWYEFHMQSSIVNVFVCDYQNLFGFCLSNENSKIFRNLSHFLAT